MNIEEKITDYKISWKNISENKLEFIRSDMDSNKIEHLIFVSKSPIEKHRPVYYFRLAKIYEKDFVEVDSPAKEIDI